MRTARKKVMIWGDQRCRWPALETWELWVCSFVICSVSVCDADKAALRQRGDWYLYRLVVLCTTTLTSVFSLVQCKLSVSGIFASRARRVVVFFFFTKIIAMVQTRGRSARTAACLMPVGVQKYRRIVTVLDALCVCAPRLPCLGAAQEFAPL